LIIRAYGEDILNLIRASNVKRRALAKALHLNLGTKVGTN
jgi:hypothetical protein